MSGRSVGSIAALVEKAGGSVLARTECVTCVSQAEEASDAETPDSNEDKESGVSKRWWRRRVSNPRPFPGTLRPLHA